MKKVSRKIKKLNRNQIDQSKFELPIHKIDLQKNYPKTCKYICWPWRTDARAKSFPLENDCLVCLLL